jgi:hypothetical protein
MLELLLTRIFSVTLWYHLAFIAISVAMFGMTLGAMLVYLRRQRFSPDRLPQNLSWAAAAFAASSVASVALILRIPLLGNPWAAVNIPALLAVSVAYCIAAVPFVFSGIAVSLALTQFPRQVGRLYAADLLGAALGCVLLIAVLDYLGAPLSVFVVAALALLAALAFAAAIPTSPRTAGILPAVFSPRYRPITLCLAISLALFVPSLFGIPLFRVTQAKGEFFGKPLYEKWNSYSRVAVNQEFNDKPFGWGLSSLTPQVTIDQKHLDIDASAGTVLTRFTGDTAPLAYLKYDVTNVAHYLRPSANVYVIGAGGGRDVLSALAFDQHHVTAVEMNKAIIGVVNNIFGDFTGHLDRNPKVSFVNDEARSYLTRTPDRYDLIQISLIDTWAATTAGAFVLSENTLYTQDAWTLFLSRLSDGSNGQPAGILSVSRWYDKPVPREVYRSVALATSTLRSRGITDTRRHILVVSQPPDQPNPVGPGTISTLLVSPQPFSDADLARIEQTARNLNFSVLLSPTHAADTTFANLADASKLDAQLAAIPADLSPPTDNRPFFFKTNSMLLGGLLTFVVLLTLVFILYPVAAKTELRLLTQDADLTLAFAAIGIAFMLIEVAQLQRLVVLLGHPTFSLSVALFGLLISSGIGASTVGNLPASSTPRIPPSILLRLAGLLASLIILGLITPNIVHALAAASTPTRVAVALALLAPAGFFMGMAFPILMRIATTRRPQASSWFWGINGGASICASVLAVMISTSFGISAAWWSGLAVYGLASALILLSARHAAAQPPVPSANPQPASV